LATAGRIGGMNPADDTTEARKALLSSLSLFRSLSARRVALLAESMIRLSFPTGAVIVREGDERDYFYVVVRGEVEVVRHGQRVGVLGPADHFGEAARWRGVAVDSTVVARAPTLLYAADASAFGAAVASSRPSWEAAASLIAERRQFDGGVRPARSS
jgi:CRP-like cAMP-binding protein